MNIRMWPESGLWKGILEDEGMLILSVSTTSEESTKHLLMALTQCHMQCVHTAVLQAQAEKVTEYDA